MKKTVLSLFVIAAFAGSAFAADVIEMKKNVKFNHKAHAEAVKDCTKCHAAATGGRIEGFGKDWAHKNCKACHAASKVPNGCKDCHK